MVANADVVNHESATSSLQAVPPVSTAHLAESTAIIQVIERAALNPDVDIDKMERLLQMQERVMDRQAMMAYSASMTAMQTELPSIEESGQANNRCYATLEDIVDTVRPIMQKHGFTVSFRIQTLERGIQITGVLMHKDGHREETSMLLPADISGNKTPYWHLALPPVMASATYSAHCLISPLGARTTTVNPVPKWVSS